MLAAMLSSATLAHHAAPPALTASQIAFYATAATVIPVLFLAIAIQGRAYQDLLRAAQKFDRTMRAATPSGGSPSVELAAISRLLWALALLIPIAGCDGEGTAITALYQGHGTVGIRLMVLIGTLYLVFAVAIGPMVTYAIAATAAEPEAESLLKPGRPD